MARVFSDVLGLRHEADYDLTKDFVAADASALITRVRKVIAEWRAADTQADLDFKQALSVLIMLRGQLRRDARIDILQVGQLRLVQLGEEAALHLHARTGRRHPLAVQGVAGAGECGRRSGNGDHLGRAAPTGAGAGFPGG